MAPINQRETRPWWLSPPRLLATTSGAAVTERNEASATNVSMQLVTRLPFKIKRLHPGSAAAGGEAATRLK